MRYLLIIGSFLPFLAVCQAIVEPVLLPKPKGIFAFYDQCEPSIAIHPKDQNIIAAGSILNGYYYSKDGGKTWASQRITSKYGVWGDPVIMFDALGKLYYFHLANYKKTYWIDRIVCQKTEQVDKKFDQGTFPEPEAPKAQDKHWTCVDPSTNTIYMTWTQFDVYGSEEPTDSSIILFSKSTDQGNTWTKPKRISYYAGDCIDDDNTVEGAVPAVGPNGELYVTWSGPKGLVFQCSMDKGETWMQKESLIMDHVGGWTFDVPGINRCNGLPVLSCDLSNGPHKGRLYLNWIDDRDPQSAKENWISISDDKGKSWSSPIKVGTDTTGSDQFFTWMTIDQSTGYLYFVYYDRRNDHQKLNQTDVYLSVSRDGGKSFVDYRLTDSSFIPFKKVFFGDYLNISAVNGVISAIWPRMDAGKITLWTSTVRESELPK